MSLTGARLQRTVWTCAENISMLCRTFIHRRQQLHHIRRNRDRALRPLCFRFPDSQRRLSANVDALHGSIDFERSVCKIEV